MEFTCLPHHSLLYHHYYRFMWSEDRYTYYLRYKNASPVHTQCCSWHREHEHSTLASCWACSNCRWASQVIVSLLLGRQNATDATSAQHNQRDTCIERCATRMPTANWCLLFHNARNRGMPIFIRMVAHIFIVVCFFRRFFFHAVNYILRFWHSLIFPLLLRRRLCASGFGFNSWPRIPYGQSLLFSTKPLLERAHLFRSLKYVIWVNILSVWSGHFSRQQLPTKTATTKKTVTFIQHHSAFVHMWICHTIWNSRRRQVKNRQSESAESGQW